MFSEKLIKASGRLTISGAPEGQDARLVAEMARRLAPEDRPVLHIVRDDLRMSAMTDALRFFAPSIDVISIPAWDCLPYDRTSPNRTVCADRMNAFHVLASDGKFPANGRVIVTTVNAALQKAPPHALARDAVFNLSIGDKVDLDALTRYLAADGYGRASTVSEEGEYATRGGILDIFPPGQPEPLRLDLFGDVLDGVRTFDPGTQRTTGKRDGLTLIPASEMLLDEESIRRFRSGYVALFGAVADEDPLYEAISAGRRYQGMEHWLPLFHESLETIFDYAPNALISMDNLADESKAARLATIADYYEARRTHTSGGGDWMPPYKPLPPDRLYLSEEGWNAALDTGYARVFTPFHTPESDTSIDAGAKQGRDFAPERTARDGAIFDALKAHIATESNNGRKVIVASYSAGSRDRLAVVLEDHGIGPLTNIESFDESSAVAAGTTSLAVLALEHGFEADDLAVVTEQDVLGDRLIRKPRRNRKAENFISEASALAPGDYIVHVDHGIGRFEGLRTIDVSGAPHDCVELIYADGDTLLVPVENIEVLSKFGSEDATVALDKLGGHAWQARKARVKKRLRDIAEALIKVAAERELKPGVKMTPPDGLFDEFIARFPYEETDDQLSAIDDVLGDLASSKPMDRLVCGDVGFGKTEVALRTAFVAVMAGYQVAVVTPTTLLARQHLATFRERFKGLPIKVEQLSRLVSSKEAAETRKGLEAGTIEIAIGTHALLGKTVKFKSLGLLIVDEEQHFGVTQKEKLKALRANVHVLTLTATPIPRTLQLALSGVREMSVIATPPVDRLAVRTFVMPFDPVVVREALMREHYRGGQSFYVCPRISDLDEAARYLRETVPELKIVLAHGQMGSQQLDSIMNAFYDGAYDVLVSTTIIESGLDIPRANTLIVHRADMFGLAQLYQIRGRVGRAKLRAYAYFTIPPRRVPTENAERRLKVLQTLDTLGAGFSLASHDLDIRGAGNLLGEEQSGHVREVGLELYQSMLEEAVAQIRSGGPITEDEDQWSPQINLGSAVLIPESYVEDLNVRMALYRRLAQVESSEDIESFAAELIDRFGPLPEEAKHLMKIVSIKQACRAAGIEKVEAGPRGAVLAFRKNSFANPAGMVAFISKQSGTAKLRPDHKLVIKRGWETTDDRLNGVQHIARGLAEVAEAVPA